MHPDVYRQLCRAREFIDDSFSHPIDLPHISREACFSQFHFLRLFRETFGETPHQYLIKRRLEKAKELLTYTDLSITEVCFEVGFQSLGSFSSLFRKAVGHPPVSYRTKISLYMKPTGPLYQTEIPACFLMMWFSNTTTTKQG
jgi:AraC-like DNA-binding protein